MVRTRADNSARKAVAAKAPRKQLGSASGAGCSSKTPSKKGGYSSGGGGNPLRVCDIPSWQKGIGEFYPTLKKEKKLDKDDENPDQPGGKCRIVATSSDSQPGCSSSNSDVGSQMQCETSIGELDAEERGQSHDSDEETAENKTLEKNGDKEDIPEQGSSKEGTSDTNAELKTEKSLDKDDESPDQPGGECHIVATTSDSQAGCSPSNSNFESKMECETSIGASDAEERGQSQASDEESVEKITAEENGVKDNVHEQGSSKEGTSGTNAEPVAGGSSVSYDEQPGCSR